MAYPGHRSILFASCITALELLIGACVPPPVRVAPERVRAAEEGARQAIANERRLNAAAIPMRTIAVLPLGRSANDTLLTPLSYGLADLLMTDLAQSSQLRVVDRVRLDALLRELRLADSGRVDPTTAPRVGRLLQARQLVVGSIDRRPGNQIAFDLRVADVVSGQVRSAVNATSSINDIIRAEKELAFRIFNQLGINLTAAERAAIEQRRTANLAALLAYSRGVQLDVQGNYDAAAIQYERARVLDPKFTAASLWGRQGQLQASTIASATTPLTRAATTATEHVNTTSSFTPPRPGGGSVDPQVATLARQTAIIIIRFSVPIVVPPPW